MEEFSKIERQNRKEDQGLFEAEKMISKAQRVDWAS